MRQSLVVFTISLLFACKSDPKFAPELMLGNWKGVDWKVQGKSAPDRSPDQVGFSFEKVGEDASAGNYTAKYGAQNETGVYRVAGDKLYTTAQGEKVEKVVRIVRLDAQNLVLDMNRGGTPEELILAKN